MSILNKTRVAVTGACGTVGSALIERLAQSQEIWPESILGLDNDESALFYLDQAFLRDEKVSFRFVDVRDKDALDSALKGIDVLFHAAALKHVVISERSPYEAVRTNIEGVQNVIHAANRNSIARVIFTSSDKAVNPTSVMGTSKLMGERLITAANAAYTSNTKFASTRFGNVLGSSGSVVPIFKRQIRKGGPVTLTDRSMTRFVMSIEEAADLVLRSVDLVCGGEVFITKMPVLKIIDLAEVMIESLAPNYGYSADQISIESIGMKPGEKLYEELMSGEETRRAFELEEFFAIIPAFRGVYGDIDYKYSEEKIKEVSQPYNSSLQSVMTKEQIRIFLEKSKLLSTKENEFDDQDLRYWPGDKEEIVRR